MFRSKRNTDSVDISRYLQSGLSSLRHDDVCTDFEVTVGDKCFRCHKVVLAAVSDYFKAMFSSGMKETVQNKATLNDILPEVFESTLSMIYDETGEMVHDLNKKGTAEMEEYLRAAGMLQIAFLKEICIQHFKEKLNVHNCMEIWKMARTLQIQELQDISWKFILSRFSCLAKVDMLPSLEFDDFKALIKDENLMLGKEEVVCDAILSWVQFEKDREDKIEQLLSCSSLSQVNIEYLVEVLSFHPLCRNNEKALELIKQAVRYKFHQDQHGNLSLSLRSCTGMEQMFLLLGARANIRDSITEVKSVELVAYSRRQRKWMRLQRSFQHQSISEEFACCVYGSAFYVTGGKTREIITLKYSGDSSVWQEQAAMIVPLRKHTMTAHGDFLYVFGGCSRMEVNSQILAYNTTDDSWDFVGELIAPVHSASSVCLNDSIFIVGGVLNNDIIHDGSEMHVVDSVQVFQTETKACTLYCHLPSPCSFSRAVCDSNNIFVITRSGDVIRLTNNTEPEVIAQIQDFSRTNYGAILDGKTLSIYGGAVHTEEDGVKLSKDVYMIDITSGMVSASSPLPMPLEVFASMKLVMRSKTFTMEQ